MSIDLSIVSDDFLTLILLRVPVKDLIGKCTQVSPQWNRILSESFFWRKKMEYDGYLLEWSKLVGLSTKSFKSMALKHCFGRNFIQDCWNLDDRSLTMDQRWELDRIVWKEEDDVVDGDDETFSRIEIPPKFLDGQPEIPPGYAEPIEACIAIPYQIFTKEIKIKLADEGLTDEIMDNFRPTIVVSEMVANRRDCTSLYQRLCSLVVNIDADPYEFEPFRDNIIPNGNQREKREVHSDVENGRWVGASIAVQFNESEAEGWHSVEHIFKDYPKGMRYLLFNCGGFGNDENKEDKYGLKMANCSVKALLEKNAE